MRKYLSIALLFLFVRSVSAQELKDVFIEQTPITWLGVDFSKARFVGDPEKLNSEEEIQKFMSSINDLMLTESEKFNIAGMLHREKVENAINITAEKNKTLSLMDKRVQNMDVLPSLKKADVDEIIQSYDFGGKEGIGIMFNIDQLNKYNQKGYLWVTFVNMKTKTVLLTERFSCTAVGFGLRNYWASTIYGTIKDIKQSTYKYWRKKYSN